jgi:transposase
MFDTFVGDHRGTIWDGAVRDAAARLNIAIVPLPGYSPDLMPVEPLWRWLREDVTYHHCHAQPAI